MKRIYIVFLIGLFMLTFAYGLLIAVNCRQPFARLVAMGLTINISLYVFINANMVMGLLPVVGIPMPLVSHGGTAMLSVLFAYGLILSESIHRDVKMRQNYLYSAVAHFLRPDLRKSERRPRPRYRHLHPRESRRYTADHALKADHMTPLANFTIA